VMNINCCDRLFIVEQIPVHHKLLEREQPKPELSTRVGTRSARPRLSSAGAAFDAGARMLNGDVKHVGDSRAWMARVNGATRYRVSLVGAGWAFVGLGCGLRILQYVANRSLSIDESFLALNLIEKSPQQLLNALDFNQAAPLGFLEAEKLAITVFGRSEYALRLLPLLASLLSLVVFYRVAYRLLRPLAATLALAVFALLDPLVYYAATGKQYAFDVLGALLILAAALIVESRPLRRVELLALALFGAVLVWFSHASAFGLAALGILLALRWVESRDRKLAPVLLAVIALWTAGFTVEYALSKSNLSRIVGAFQQGGGSAFTPGASGPTWFDDTVDRLRYLVGLKDAASGQPVLGSLASGVSRGLTVLIVIVAAVGFVSLLRRRTRMAIVLAMPPVLSAVASSLHQYPLVGRTLLFALPAVALCIGEGLHVFVAAPAPKPLTRFAAIVALLCVGAVGILPAVHAVHPRQNEEMKQALRYLGAHHRRGDVLYVSSGAQYAFAYYHLCGCSPFDPETAWPFSTIGGREGSSAAVQPRSPNLIIESGRVTGDVKPPLGRGRVWALFAESSGNARNEILDSLGKHRRLLQSFHASGPFAIVASLYLYDVRDRRRR
jgi:hypothetical protein